MKWKVNKDAKDRFYSIGTLIYNKKYNLAKRELIKLLNDYPDDVGANLYYVDLLCLEGNYELANEICKEFLYNKTINYKYAKINKKIGNNEEAKKVFLQLYEENNNITALIQFITILVKEGNYALAYKYLLKIDSNFLKLNKKKNKQVTILRRYIYSFLYPELIDIFINDENLDYYSVQIINYSEKNAKENINNILSNKYKFSGDINIEELFKNAKELIKDKNCYDYDIFDKYIIHVPFKCKNDEIDTNYITVITNLNTKDIVDMYPCENYDKNVIEYKETNEENNANIKKIYIQESMIDKFNKKYGFNQN